MAEESKKPDDKEMKIPVFSVLKNGAVVKNIFLNNPQWVSGEDDSLSEEEEDSPILIGRHPDCHIALDHPSISRFHLEIRAKPASLELSIIDRSSVHGTWVSGNRIEPNIAIDLMEGDTVKLGASTRIYRLHWIPLSTVFDMENPLPSVLEENEDSHQFKYPDEVMAEEIPSAPPLLETSFWPLETENPSPLRKELEEDRSRLSSVGSSWPMEEENRTPEKNVQSGRDHLSPLASEKIVASSNLLSRRSKSKSVSFLCVQTGRNKEKNVETICDGEAVGDEEKNGAVIEQGQRETFCRALFTELDERIEDDNDKEQQEPDEEEEEEVFDSDKENMTPLSSKSQKLKKNHKEMQTTVKALAVKRLEDVLSFDENASASEVPSNLKQNKPVLDNFLMKEEYERNGSYKMKVTREFSSGGKLKKRLEEKQKSSLNAITIMNKEEDAFHSDKENSTLQVSREKKTNNTDGCILLTINGGEEDSFYSDKENLTPGVPGTKKSSKLSFKSHAGKEKIIERRKERVPFQSLLENSPSRNNCPLSNAKRRVEKEGIPFQSLMEKSPLRNSSPVKYAQNLADDSNMDSSFIHTQMTENEPHNSLSQGVERLLHQEGKSKTWNIVVDAGCFLNKESRKSLQLLEGLRGTHLIIPRIVIRELDCLKKRESLFRKDTKAASSMLQWIEECMVKCSWWIHVQSSSETLPVAPTPPATPRSQFGDGNEELSTCAPSTVAFSTCGSLMEIVSPTAEDHILDCALLFKRIKGDEQLVVLSNSVTLKIKSMAEGLLCETPKEFRTSLLDPYSKRFLWSASSPRGSTWSCVDEAAQIENYYHQFPEVRRTSKPTDCVKGLKLILLHNYQYGKTNLVK